MTTFTSLKKRSRAALHLCLLLGLSATAHAAAPDADPDFFTSGADRVQADSTKSILTATLLANDSGDDIVFNALGGTSSTAGAPISISSPIITYDPRNVAAFIALPDGDTSDDTFSYSISGSDGPNDSTTVTIRVEGVNDAPSFGALPSSPIAFNDDVPTKPFASTTVNDPDTGELVSITLDVNNADHNDGKGSFAQTPGFGGSKSFSGPTGGGVYTLTNATIAQAQAALRDLTFTPNEDYSPPGTVDDTVFSLTLTDGSLSDSGNSFTLDVTSKNDVPVLANPGGTTSYTMSAGDQADVFSQVTLADPDVDAVSTSEGDQLGFFTATITLSRAGSGSAYGTLSGPSFLTATATEYTLQGTRDELLGDIQSIAYLAPSANDTFTITLRVNDPIPSNAASNNIVITATVTQPDPGIIGLVPTQSISDKNTTLPFAGAIFNNFGSEDRRVIVTVGSSGGVEGAFDVLAGFTNEGGGVYSFVGSSVEATNALRALRFKPTPDRIIGASEAVAFAIEVQDTDTDATLDSVSPAVTLTVTPVNDAPTISSPNAEIRINDDAVGTKPFAGVVLNDPDEGGSQTIYVTVTLVGEDLDTGAARNGGGTLSTSTTPTLGFVKTGDPVFTYTFSGTPTEVNTLLQNLVFTPDGDRNPEGERESITFTLLVEDTDDSSGLSAQNQGTSVIVLSVNGAPVIGGVPPLAQQPFPVPGSPDAGGIYTATPFENLTVDDDDGGDLTFSIALDDADKGTLVDSGSDFTSSDSGLTYTMVGTIAEIQTALQGLVYTLDKGYVFPLDALGGTTFTLTATDSSAGNITTKTFAIVIRERNVAYIVTNTNDTGTGSLREAVSQTGNNDFIVFELPADEYPATIHLQSPLTIDKNTSIIGSGVKELTISGDSDDDGVGDVSLFIVTDGADLTLEHLTLKLGKAPSYGGAVAAVDGSRIVVRFCSFEENTAGQFGGAIDLLNGELLVENCLFLNNSVDVSTAISGGAISVTTTQASVIRNSTFVGNAQLNGGGAGGGAIYAENSLPSQSFDLLVEHCTFKDNTDAAAKGTSMLAATSGLEVTVRNNIFGDEQGQVLNVSGDAVFTSLGGNIATDATTTVYTDDPRDISLLDASIDELNAEPLLLELADNGGETLTCALDASSPALDSAVVATPLTAQTAIDQRGVWRDATPDAGAFESGIFKRIMINELFVNTDTGEDQFIEFYNPRDSESLSLNGLEVFVDGDSAGVLSGLPTLLPGAGLAWPSGAGLNLNKEKGRIELRNADGQVVLLLGYISSFVDELGDVDMLGQSITRYPRYEGGLLPHERVYVLVNGTATGLTSTSPNLDVNGSPLDGGNAPPIAVNDLTENEGAIYSILADETLNLDVLANDVEFDRTDTLKITEVMELEGDPATVVAGEFTNLLGQSVELGGVAAPGDILFPITPVAVTTPVLFDPTDASLSIDPGEQALTYDPTNSPQVIALAKGATLTDYWAYTILDYNASDVAQSRGTGATIQENNIKKATAYFKVVITGLNETPEAVDDVDPDLATTENRALRILADADLLTASPEFDFTDQDADFQEFDAAGVPGTFKPFYPEYALLANDDDVDDDDTNKTIRIIAVHTTSVESDELTTSSELGASVTLDLRAERIETNVLYDPRASSVLNTLSAGETVTDSFYYSVIDRHGARDVAKVSIEITGVNDVPTATDDPGFTANEDKTLVIAASELTSNDADPDQNGSGSDDMPVIQQPIVPTTSAQGATLDFNGTTITYDPRTIPTYESLARNETLEDSFTYTLLDNNGGSDVATVSITVEGRNDAPTAVDDFRDVTENDTATVAAPGVLINDGDVDINGTPPDDDPWIIPQRGVVTGLGASLNINPDGSYRYDANSVAIDALIEDEEATEIFPYTITDNSRTSASADRFRVLSGQGDVALPLLLNDSVAGAAPVAVEGYAADPSNEGVLVIESANHSLRNGLLVKIEGYAGSGAYNGVYAITSIDRDHFSVAVPFADDPAGMRGTWVPWFAITNVTLLDKGGTVDVIDGQTVLYTAAAGFAGEESFRYTIEDGVGGQDVATVVVEVVEPTQNALLVASPDRYRVGKGTADVQIDVLTNDVTLPGNLGALTILEVNAIGGALGAVDLVGGQTALSYTPPSDTFTGEEAFTYTISAGGVATSQTTVTFVVEDRTIGNPDNALLGQLSGNDDAFVVVSESTGNVLDVLANDPNRPNFPVSPTILSVTTPSSGSVSSDGSLLTYDAPIGIGSGLDTFEYTAVDASGATTTQTVTIQIVENVQTFIAQPDHYTVVAGSGMVLLPVLSNDRTVLNDTAVLRIEKLGLDGDAPPNVNRVAITADENFIEYTPPLTVPALGEEDFNYEIGIGGTDLVEAKITIKVVDSLPIQTQAEDDFFTVARDSGAQVLDLVNNDLPYPLAGWSWTITDPGTPSHGGIVTIEGDSTVSYQSAEGFFGTETFTYEIQDVFGASSTATVTVKVGEFLTAPDAYVVLANSTDNRFDVLANDDLLGRYGEDYTITLVDGQTELGTVALDGAGPNNQVLYTPLAGFTGEEEFDYTITDESGNTTKERVTVTVIAEDSDRDFADLEVTITGINDIPQVTSVVDGATNDKTSVNVFPSISITDLDEFGLQSQTVTVTFDASAGTVISTGFTQVSPGVYRIVGTPAAVVAALQAFVFVPTENIIDYINPGSAEVDFDLTVNDGYTGGLVTDQATITVTPVNDAPTVVSLIPDMLLQVNSPPRARQLAPHFADVDDDVATGELTWTVAGNSNPGLFDSVSIDATKQLVVLTFAADAFGQADLTIQGTDRGLLSVQTTFTVTVEGPPVIELDVGESQPPAAGYTGSFNSNGFIYRQSFRVTNEGTLPADAFIVSVTGLDQFSADSPAKVLRGEYSSNENGTPDNFGDDTLATDGVILEKFSSDKVEIKYDKPLASGESIVVHVVYQRISFVPVNNIRPTIEIKLSTSSPMEGAGTVIESVVDGGAGEMKITFPVEAGRTYQIEYTSDLSDPSGWQTWGDPITIGTFDQKLVVYDDGLFTDPHPSLVAERFYRVVDVTVGP